MKAVAIVLLGLTATLCGIAFLLFALIAGVIKSAPWILGGFALLFLMEWLAWRWHK